MFYILIAAKLRLSNSIYNQETEDILVAAITSNLYEKRYSVLISNDDMKEGTLKVTSSIFLISISCCNF